MRRAEAAAPKCASAIPEADNGIAAAKANLDLAQATFRRIEELASKKSVSNQEFDEASARLEGRAGGLRHGAREAGAARFRSWRRSSRRFAPPPSCATTPRIAAPFAGVVTARSVEPGNLAAPGAPLLTHRARRRLPPGSVGGRIAARRRRSRARRSTSRWTRSTAG